MIGFLISARGTIASVPTRVIGQIDVQSPDQNLLKICSDTAFAIPNSSTERLWLMRAGCDVGMAEQLIGAEAAVRLCCSPNDFLRSAARRDTRAAGFREPDKLLARE